MDSSARLCPGYLVHSIFSDEYYLKAFRSFWSRRNLRHLPLPRGGNPCVQT